MLREIIEVAAQYASLGDAIQCQIKGLLDDCYGDAQVTAGAAEYIGDRLLPALERLAEAVDSEELADEIQEFTHQIAGAGAARYGPR